MATYETELKNWTWHDGFLRAIKGKSGFLAPESRVTRIYLLGIKHHLYRWIGDVDAALETCSRSGAVADAGTDPNAAPLTAGVIRALADEIAADAKAERETEQL